MTTKTYIIQERDSKGEWANQAEYKTRKEALATIGKILGEDETADPQNFKIVEIEVKNDLGKIAEKVASILANIEQEPTIKIEKIERTAGMPFMLASITRPQQYYLPLCSLTIKAIVEALEGWRWCIDDKGKIKIFQDITE